MLGQKMIGVELFTGHYTCILLHQRFKHPLAALDPTSHEVELFT